MNAAQGGPWTRHGHEIADVTVAGGRPPAVARCGGPALCRQCREDVATALGEKPAAPDRPTREQAAEALHYAAGLSDRDVDDTPRESYMSDTIRILAVEVRALRAEQALGRATAEAWAAIHPDSRVSVSRFQPRLAEALDQLVAYVEER